MNPASREYTTSVILNPPAELESQRTYVIFGTRRGGTSMVAGLARALGLDLGRVGQRKNNEDPRFQNRPLQQMRAAVEERNSESDVWGWKFPAAGSYLLDLANGLRNPYFIIIYRDPVAAALSQARRDRKFNQRTSRLSLHESAANVTVNTGLVLAADRPSLLVSNERAMADSDGFIDDMAAFLGAEPPTGERREKIRAYIAPGQYKSFDEFFDVESAGGDQAAAAGGAPNSPEPGAGQPARERSGLLRRLRAGG
jgi:hypothetical protein